MTFITHCVIDRARGQYRTRAERRSREGMDWTTLPVCAYNNGSYTYLSDGTVWPPWFEPISSHKAMLNRAQITRAGDIAM